MWPLGALAAIAAFLVASTWTAPGSPPSAEVAMLELLAAAPSAAAWLLMAFGFGGPLRRALRADDASAGALQLGLGVAFSLAAINALASLGLMTTAGAWIALSLGALLGVASLATDRPRIRATGGIAAAAGPAIGVLMLASLSPPGWLWSTEFGGYDALSYHLQLPKEWLAEGRLHPSTHCVYGFLPGFMESAYLQIMALRGDSAEAAQAAATSCQLLHALMTVLAAWCTGQAAGAWWNATLGACAKTATSEAMATGVATALVLCTPWSVVVGSLAYNEMAVVLLLAAGMSALTPVGADSLDRWADRWAGRSIAIGLLAGAACGAKLTAAGFAAVPMGMLLLGTVRPGRRLPAALLCVGAAMVVLLPWLVRNGLAAGNPIFPFATSLLGGGHWTPEQAELFARGHGSDLGAGGRLLRLWQQWLTFGLGANPQSGEPWQPQWSLTPWLGALGLLALLLPWPRSGSDLDLGRARGSVTTRLAAVLAIQLAMWLVATHLQSRFLLPTVVPAAIAAALGAARWSAGGAGPPAGTCVQRALWVSRIAAIGILALALIPALVLRRERGGAPSEAIGASAQLSGAGPVGSAAEDLPAHWLNHRLPGGSRVLLVGDARPFWYRGAPAAYAWQTTWDRGPMSMVLAAHPGDADAQRTALRRMGFTHVLVDPAMLERWQRSGWADPALDARTLLPLLEAPNRVLKRFPGGGVLLELGA